MHATVSFRLCCAAKLALNSSPLASTSPMLGLQECTTTFIDLHHCCKFPCRGMNNWVPAPYRSATINFSRMHQSPTWEANEFIVLTYRACKGLCTKAWLSEILTAQVCLRPSQLNRWRPTPFFPFTVHSCSSISRATGVEHVVAERHGSEQSLRRCPVARPPPPKKKCRQSPAQVWGLLQEAAATLMKTMVAVLR